MKKKYIIILSLLFISTPAFSYMTSGTGTKTCEQWIKNKEESLQITEGRNVIRAATIQWIRGYLSALNFLSEINNNKFKDFSNLKGEELLLELENFCQNNSKKLIEDFTLQIWSELPYYENK